MAPFITALAASPETVPVTTTVTTADTAVKIGIRIALGLCISLSYMLCNRKSYSRNFALSLVILPALVAVVIWMIGSDIAIAISLGGIFSLIRFRSAPGDAKDITNVFFTMAVGLAVGLGYYAVAVIMTVVIACVWTVFSVSPFAKKNAVQKQLRITIPENLNYEGAFDSVFAEYAVSYSLEEVKTTHMGTLFELNYLVSLRNGADEKAFLDALRVRNGNLNIMLCKRTAEKGPNSL